MQNDPESELSKKLDEVLNVIDDFKGSRIDSNLVQKVLKIQNLMGEI